MSPNDEQFLSIPEKNMFSDSGCSEVKKTQHQIFVKFWFFVFVFSFFSGAILLSSLHPADVRTATTDVPTIITYQGKLLESGSAVSTTKTMAFTIYDASTGGNLLYTASGTLSSTSTINVTPTSGVFAVELGGTGTNSLTPEIFQTNGSLYLQVIVGGEPLSPRKQLTSAPFAFNAQYLLGVAATSTASSSQYIPISNDQGYFNFTRVGVNTSSPGLPLSVSGSSYFALDASDSVHIDASTTVHSEALDGALRVDYRGSASNAGSIWSGVQLQNDTQNTVFNYAALLYGTAGGHASGNKYSGYFTDLNGTANDTDVEYVAFDSDVFDRNGGTSTSTALRVNAGYSYIINAEAGDLLFVNYDPTIQTWGGSFAIDASGGSLNLNTTNNSNVNIGTGRTTITGSLGVTSTLDVDSGTLYVDATNDRVGISSSTPVYTLAVEGDSYFSNTSTFAGPATIIGNADAPFFTASTTSSTLLDAISAVDIEGDYAYAVGADSDSLAVINISDLTGPAIVGSIIISGGEGGLDGATSIDVVGDYAFITSLNGFIAFDVSDKTAPVFLDGFATGSVSLDAEVVGNYAYVAHTTAGDDALSIIDISDIENLSAVGSVASSTLDYNTVFSTVAVSGRYAYVLGTSGGYFNVIDVSDPTNPEIVGTILGSGGEFSGESDIRVIGQYAYVIAGGNLSIIDISDPTNPAVVGTNSAFTGGAYLEVTGGYAYIFDTSDRLYVADVSSSTNPVVGELIIDDSIFSAVHSPIAHGNYLYAPSEGFDSLVVLDISGTKITQADIGTAKATNLQVMGTALFDRSLDVRGGLSVGSGLFLSGGFAMSASSTNNELLFSIQNIGSKIFSILGNGNIGVGTTTPSALFSINSDLSDSSLNVFEIYSDVLADDDLVFRVTASGTTFADGAYNATGADYAEYFYTLDTDLVSGETVCVDIAHEHAVRRCLFPADGNVMGIVSSRPSIVGNSSDEKLNNPHYVVVGMIGQVPAKVTDENGPVRVGDSLTSASVPGYAMRANAGDPTVGVALERLDSGIGTIQVLISRRNKSITVETVEEQITDRIAAMEIEDEVEILVSTAVDQLDLNDEISLIVDQKLDAVDIPGIVDTRLDDLNIGGLIDDALTQVDVVSLIASNVDPIRDTLGISGFVESTVSSTALQDQPVVTELLGKAEATDITLAELLLSDQETLGELNSIEERIFVLEQMQGVVADELQGEWAPYLSVGELTVEQSLAVLGDLRVEKHNVFSGDTVGQAKILSGDSLVHVVFDQPYQYQPIITLTLRGESVLATTTAFKYTIIDESTSGFTIKMNLVQEDAVAFNWHAFGANKAKIFVSDNTVEDIQIVLEEPPVSDAEIDIPTATSSTPDTIPADPPATETSTTDTDASPADTSTADAGESEDAAPSDADAASPEMPPADTPPATDSAAADESSDTDTPPADGPVIDTDVAASETDTASPSSEATPADTPSTPDTIPADPPATETSTTDTDASPADTSTADAGGDTADTPSGDAPAAASSDGGAV